MEWPSVYFCARTYVRESPGALHSCPHVPLFSRLLPEAVRVLRPNSSTGLALGCPMELTPTQPSALELEAPLGTVHKDQP